MAETSRRKIRIQWVRSTIASGRRARVWIRSLGLRRLHQIVERPDTPQVRGLLAKLPRLVKLVEVEPKPPLDSVPEYTLAPPEVVVVAARPKEEVAEVGVGGATSAGAKPKARGGSAKASPQKTAEAHAAMAKAPKAKKPGKAAAKGKGPRVARVKKSEKHTGGKRKK